MRKIARLIACRTIPNSDSYLLRHKLFSIRMVDEWYLKKHAKPYMQVLLLGTPLAADGHLRTCIRALAHANDSCERCECRNTIMFINIVIVVRRMDCITSIMIIITDMATLAIFITII